MTVTLTPAEVRAIRRALTYVLDGCARDLDELRKEGFRAATVRVMLNAEKKLGGPA